MTLILVASTLSYVGVVWNDHLHLGPNASEKRVTRHTGHDVDSSSLSIVTTPAYSKSDDLFGVGHVTLETGPVPSTLSSKAPSARPPLCSEVNFVGSRPVGTYLCDYFPDSKKISGGCQLVCGQERVVCNIRGKGSDATLLSADIVVHHHGPVPKKLRPQQYTLYYSGESDTNERKKATPQYRSQFDFSVSYHTNRTYHFTWTNRFSKNFLNNAKGPTNGPAWSSRRRAAAMFVSGCGRGKRRLQLLQQLKDHFPVHSYGKCMNTHSVEKEFPQCAARKKYEQKLCVFQQYQFAVAFDNSPDVDYVTEKVYHALLSGAIPIYDGASNVENFVPARDSVVHVGDYSSMAHLARYLKEIGSRGDAPSNHTEWRSLKPSEWNSEFLRHLSHPEPTCDICRKVASLKQC